MPIYEYLCQVCGHALEVIQKVSDPMPAACPACAKPALKKQVSAAGFQLKGSGWYATDFKNKDKKQDKKETQTAETKSESTAPESGTKDSTGCGGGACGCH